MTCGKCSFSTAPHRYSRGQSWITLGSPAPPCHIPPPAPTTTTTTTTTNYTLNLNIVEAVLVMVIGTTDGEY